MPDEINELLHPYAVENGLFLDFFLIKKNRKQHWKKFLCQKKQEILQNIILKFSFEKLFLFL